MARAIVRGMDPAWIRSIYSMALVPDAVIYLRIGVDELIPRVIFPRGFDYWESGMDVFPGQDMYENFRSYQTALLAEFERLSVEFHFETVDGSADVKTVFTELQQKILRIVESDSRREYFSKATDELAESLRMKLEESWVVRLREMRSKDLQILPRTEDLSSNGNGHRIA